MELLGVTIHEPDVALTDLALAIETSVFAWLLGARGDRRALRTLVVLLFAALAASSLFGAVFHAFFPAKTATAAGHAMWLLVTAAIGCTASALWLIDALLLRGPSAARAVGPIVVAYFGGFMAVIVLVDHSYATVIGFYAPPLILLTAIAIARVLREPSRLWSLLLTGLLLSFAAAGLQLFDVGLHPVYFNANALYHVVQGIGLAFLFVAFRGALSPAGGASGSMTRVRP